MPPGRRAATGAVALAVAVAAWELCADTGLINPLLFSSPSKIAREFWTLAQDGTLGAACASTASLFAVGLGASVAAGTVLGVVIGWYGGVAAALDPFVSVLYAAPRIALIPLIGVWFGVGFTAQVVIVFLTAVFPIVINIAAGIETADRQLLLVARSFQATSARVLLTIAIPGALPHFISALRQGIAQGLIGVVVAEYFIGNGGLGGLIVTAGDNLNSAQAFVGVLVFAAAALILTESLRYAERRLTAWRP